MSVWDAISSVAEDILDIPEQAIETVGDIVTGTVSTAGDIVTGTVGTAGDIVTGTLDTAGGIVSDYSDVVKVGINEAGETIREVGPQLAPMIGGAALLATGNPAGLALLSGGLGGTSTAAPATVTTPAPTSSTPSWLPWAIGGGAVLLVGGLIVATAPPKKKGT